MLNCYATLAQFKSKGWADIPDTTYDTDYLSIIAEASRQVDKDTNRFFYLWEGIRYYNGGGTRVILLDDIYSITSVDVDSTGAGLYQLNYDYTITPPDFYVYPENKTPITTLEINPWGRYGTFYDGFRKNIKITGVFGHGADYPESAWVAVGDTVRDNPMTNSQVYVTVTNPSGNLFSAGMTLRFDTEQVFVTAVLGTKVDITRGVNGTTASSHTQGATIYAPRYPEPIVRATLIQTLRLWKRRESGYATRVGNTITGDFQSYRGSDEDYSGIIQQYRRERFEKWVT